MTKIANFDTNNTYFVEAVLARTRHPIRFLSPLKTLQLQEARTDLAEGTRISEMSTVKNSP